MWLRDCFLAGSREGSMGISVTTCLLIKLLFFTLLHAARCLELLEDASLDRLGLPLYYGIPQFSPQIQPFHLIPMHT